MTDTAVKKSRRTPLIILGVVLVGAAVLLYYFFGGEAPGAVNIDSAAAAVTTGVATSAVVGTEVAPVADATEAIDGTWTIDTTVGEFSVTEDTAATFAGFRVNEVLDAIGETVAVGRTPNVRRTLESPEPPSTPPTSPSTSPPSSVIVRVERMPFSAHSTPQPTHRRPLSLPSPSTWGQDRDR